MDSRYTSLIEKKIPLWGFFKGLGLFAAVIYCYMLVVVSSLAAVYTNAMKVLFIVILICAVAYAVLTRRKLTFNPAVAGLLMFALFVLITCIWAENKALALSETGRVLQLVGLSLGLYLLIDTENDVRLMINALLVGGLYMICSALLTYGISQTLEAISTGGRVALLQANLFSAILNLTNAIMMFYILFEKKYWYAVPLVISLILLLGTGSRTGFIVFCVQALIYIIFKIRSDGLKFAIPAVAVLAALMIIVLPRLVDMAQYNERIQSIGDFLTEDADELSKEEDRDGSLVKRKIMLEFGDRLIKKKPILGYGLGHYEYYFNIEYEEWRPPHSTYIQLMVGTGLIGTVFYYSVYVIPGAVFCIYSMRSAGKRSGTEDKKTDKSARKWGKAIHKPGGYSPLFADIIVMYLVSNLSTNMLMNKYPYVFFGLFAAYLGIIRRNITKKKLNGIGDTSAVAV